MEETEIKNRTQAINSIRRANRWRTNEKKGIEWLVKRGELKPLPPEFVHAMHHPGECEQCDKEDGLTNG